MTTATQLQTVTPHRLAFQRGHAVACGHVRHSGSGEAALGLALVASAVEVMRRGTPPIITASALARRSDPEIPWDRVRFKVNVPQAYVHAVMFLADESGDGLSLRAICEGLEMPDPAAIRRAALAFAEARAAGMAEVLAEWRADKARRRQIAAELTRKLHAKPTDKKRNPVVGVSVHLRADLGAAWAARMAEALRGYGRIPKSER